jgi:integrase
MFEILRLLCPSSKYGGIQQKFKTSLGRIYSRAHTTQGLIDPTKSDLVRTVMRGIRRSTVGRQRQAAPVLKEDLLPMLACMHGTKGIRDRALILVGFAAALRRSELVALDVDELQFVSEGLLIYLSRSKTDQEGEGRRIAVPYGRTSACAVTAMRNWLGVSGITTGAVFRSIGKSGVVAASRLSDQSVSLIVKKYALAVGLPAMAYSGHSLRAGLVTSAAKAGVSFSKIQQQTGHRSTEMLTRYIRDANVFQDNAAGLLL